MSTTQDDTFDPSQRRLCPDGSCLGLLGSDGRCKVCGTLGSGGAAVTPVASPPVAPSPEPEINVEAGPPAAFSAESAFDPDRRLCPDDACIGVIGINNKCGVCGRQG